VVNAATNQFRSRAVVRFEEAFDLSSTPGKANRDRLRSLVENSIGIVTALNPYIGYLNATQVAQEALVSGRSVAEIVIERGLLTRAQLDDILKPTMLTQPRHNLPLS
jgi:aspartate ammonia-lyase